MLNRKLLACLPISMLLVVCVAFSPVRAESPTDKTAKNLTPTQKLVQDVQAVSLAKEPLEKALKRLSDLAGLEVRADWSALEPLGVNKDTPVSLKAGKMKFGKLLDLALNTIAPKDHPLAWYLSDNQVVVTTQMRALMRDRVGRLPISGGTVETKKTGRETAAGGVRKLEFNETPLETALDFLRDLAGVNLVVNWKSLEVGGLGKDTPVTLKANDISVGQALDLVLSQLNVGRDRMGSIYYIVEDGMVKIASGEALSQTTKTKVFDISDLLMVVPDYAAPDTNMLGNVGANGMTGNNGTGGGWGGWGNTSNNSYSNNGGNNGTGNTNIGAQRQVLADNLIEIIKVSIGNDMWQPDGKGSIKLLGTKLVISQTPLGFKLLEQSFR